VKGVSTRNSMTETFLKKTALRQLWMFAYHSTKRDNPTFTINVVALWFGRRPCLYGTIHVKRVWRYQKGNQTP